MGKIGCRLMGWCVLLGLVSGCQGQSIFTWWKSRQDEEYRLLLKSVDEYARKQGLSREQAIRQLREEADRYALEQQRTPRGPSVPPTRQLGQEGGGVAAQASWIESADQGTNAPTMRQKSSSFSSHQGMN